MSLETMQIMVESRLTDACQASADFNVPIEYTNVRFNPPAKAAYVAVHVMDGRSLQAEIAERATVRFPGVVQIDCLVPEDTGTKYLNQLADFVGDVFNRKQFTLQDQAKVTFRTPFNHYMGKANGWCRTVVSLEYYRDEAPSLP